MKKKKSCGENISHGKHMEHVLWDKEHHLWGQKAQVSEVSLNARNLAWVSKQLDL